MIVNGMRTRRTSQVKRERSSRLERWSARNLSSEDERPEVGMNGVVERVGLRLLYTHKMCRTIVLWPNRTKQILPQSTKRPRGPVVAMHV